MSNTFNFQQATQGNASTFASRDSLNFSTGSPTDLHVSYTPASGSTAASVTLTSGTKSLTFDAATLHDSTDAGLVTFPSGALYVAGTAGSTYSTSPTSASALYGLDGNDGFTIGGSAKNYVNAGGGDDHIVVTGSGAMTLAGGTGADVIDATVSTGNLHIYGNTDITMRGDTDGNDIIHLGTGSNYANGNAGDDYIDVKSGGTGVNRLIGGGGNDTIVGGDGQDLVQGNLGNDSLLGGNGDDVIHGGQGDDMLVGGAGNDQLFGDMGNDTLIGGTGIDRLTGGAGNDVFVFAVGDAPPPATSGAFAGQIDQITDFTVGQDKIDLAMVTATTAAHLIFQAPGTAAITTEAAAQAYAQTLLNASTTVGAHDIVALQLGHDTFLFSHEAGAGTTIDTVIKLGDLYNASTLTSASFI